MGPIVDSHVHFWEPRTLHYPWLTGLPALHGPFLPPDYSAAIGELPVEKTVVVECNCLGGEAHREVELFERLHETDCRIAGIVAFVDLTHVESRDDALDRLATNGRVKGVRQNIQGQPPGFALQRAFVSGVQEVAARGLTFDLCVTHDQLGEAIALVEQCPGGRFVLDHCGKPAIRERLSEPWRHDMARLAAHDNVWCKVSGLLTEADVTSWREEDLRPYADHVVEQFGTGRILYGSDWPVLTLAGDYGSWFAFTARFTETWSEAERRRFYYDNAVEVYGL
jgi:predicted TIM-barrel fold metal-dependent hydrolase